MSNFFDWKSPMVVAYQDWRKMVGYMKDADPNLRHGWYKVCMNAQKDYLIAHAMEIKNATDR